VLACADIFVLCVLKVSPEHESLAIAHTRVYYSHGIVRLIILPSAPISCYFAQYVCMLPACVHDQYIICVFVHIHICVVVMVVVITVCINTYVVFAQRNVVSKIKNI
jgi:hypothetical protein